MDWLTQERVSIILVVAGTLLLAFSVQPRGQYRDYMRQAVERIKRRRDLIEPTDTRISPLLFWGGLLCVLLGAVLQW